MNKLKIALSLIALSALCALAQEQYATWRVIAGLSLSSIDYEDDDRSDASDNISGIQIGIIGDAPINNLLSFQTGLIFIPKGGDFSEKGYTSEISLRYLQLPLLLSAKLPVLSELIAARVSAGAYYSWGLYGTVERTGSKDIDAFGDDDDDAGLSRHDYGLSFGLGAEFKQFYFGLSYDMGLRNMVDSDDVDYTNSTLSFTVGYIF
jgi:hypothetical protein